MADQKTRLVLNDFSGGRNAIDSPLGPNFRANQVVEAVDGDWYHTSGFRKRNGSSDLGMTSSGAPFAGVVSWLGRHVPGTAEGAAELWAVDDFIPPAFQRLTGGVTWANVTVTNAGAIGTNTWDFTSASLNGKFFIAFPGLSNRLHVWDAPAGVIRSTGINPGLLAPTVADTGGGTYAATLRYYRVRFVAVNWTRISEPTAAVAFTPSGAGTAAEVTQPAVPNEGETDWVVEASADGATYYVISSAIPIATTTFDDTVDPTAYSASALSPLTGTYSLQGPYRFIAADQNRLIGFGSYDSTAPQHRFEWSAIVGSTDLFGSSTPATYVQTNFAEERVDTTIQSYRDLDDGDSGVPAGLIGPVWGNYYPFKTRQLWEAAPTGSTDQPYRFTVISKELGAVGPRAMARGEDGQGNPCFYFMSHRGVYRYGDGGLTYIGAGIEDLILGPTARINLTATQVVAHMVYHQEKRQLWVWHATGTSNDPDTLSMFDVRANNGQGGWSRYTGPLAHARCSVMFSADVGATMGIPLVPYLGDATQNNVILTADDGDALDDRGEAFRAYLTTRPLEVPGYKIETGDAIVLAPTATGVILTATVTPDFGAGEGVDGVADLTALDSEFDPSRVSRRCEGTALAGCEFLQLTVGDATAIANAWSLDRIVIPISKQQAVS